MLLFTLFRIRNNNCSIELYSRYLQTRIIRFTRNVCSHKTDWKLSEFPLPGQSCLLYRRVNSLMNALEGERLCLCQISINVNKLFIVIVVFYLRLSLQCWFCMITRLSPFLYWCCCYNCCLFLDQVNKSIVFVLVAFVYYFCAKRQHHFHFRNNTYKWFRSIIVFVIVALLCKQWKRHTSKA